MSAWELVWDKMHRSAWKLVWDKVRMSAVWDEVRMSAWGVMSVCELVWIDVHTCACTKACQDLTSCSYTLELQ